MKYYNNRDYINFQKNIESNAITYPNNFPIALKRAKGSILEDMESNTFIDFLSGAGVLALGHNDSNLNKAICKQLECCSHALDFQTPIKKEFMEWNLKMLPEKMQKCSKIHFCGPAGADAVDAAIKLAKIYTKESDIISFHGSFHGSTQSTISLTGLLSIKQLLPNLLPGVNFFPYSYCYRCPINLSPKSCSTNCITYLLNMLKDPNSGIKKPAAVILEIIQGEGGVIPATKKFVQELRNITQKNNIVLIVDEIQSGCGRTGKWFAFENYDIIPDIITVSKAIGGGLPAALIIYNNKLDVWQPGAHTGTFRGNQLAFASGVEFMKYVSSTDLLAEVTSKGEYIKKELYQLKNRHQMIGDIRGLGLMLGIEIVNPITKEINPDYAKIIQNIAFKNGLIFELGGRSCSVIRFLPALNISMDLIKKALKIIEDAFKQVEHKTICQQL